ncbi:MAG: hypothetical protein J3Q66DRAFT_128474 [Benniella sp.]|nr:MAG: hypothetical protein J3Q66DRAFT_128474 [Benniella sp.]
MMGNRAFDRIFSFPSTSRPLYLEVKPTSNLTEPTYLTEKWKVIHHAKDELDLALNKHMQNRQMCIREHSTRLPPLPLPLWNHVPPGYQTKRAELSLWRGIQICYWIHPSSLKVTRWRCTRSVCRMEYTISTVTFKYMSLEGGMTVVHSGPT